MAVMDTAADMAEADMAEAETAEAETVVEMVMEAVDLFVRKNESVTESRAVKSVQRERSAEMSRRRKRFVGTSKYVKAER